MSTLAESPEFLSRMKQAFFARVPHAQALGMAMEKVGSDFVLASLPYQPYLLADIERRIIHTGVVTTLIDTVSGAALLARLRKPDLIATLDLRVDYLRAPRADLTLWCRAECTRVTDSIAFVRSRVWQASEQEPVAESLASFMRSARKAP